MVLTSYCSDRWYHKLWCSSRINAISNTTKKEHFPLTIRAINPKSALQPNTLYQNSCVTQRRVELHICIFQGHNSMVPFLFCALPSPAPSSPSPVPPSYINIVTHYSYAYIHTHNTARLYVCSKQQSFALLWSLVRSPSRPWKGLQHYVRTSNLTVLFIHTCVSMCAWVWCCVHRHNKITCRILVFNKRRVKDFTLLPDHLFLSLSLGQNCFEIKSQNFYEEPKVQNI